MEAKQLKGGIDRISSLFDIYDELSPSGFEFKVAKEQLLKALLDAKKDLKELEVELQNEE